MNRRNMLKLSSYAAAAAASRLPAQTPKPAPKSAPVPRWDFIELSFTGPQTGNPFVDVQLRAEFRRGDRTLSVEGFYDGVGSYKVRFMPDEPGTWAWTTTSTASQLDKKSGTFECVAPDDGNRGPVSVRDGFHFGYADGTPYVEAGTTCYAWAFQPEETQRQTVETLSRSPFNKLRMCLFPKWYEYNRKEPALYPFPRTGETNDYSHFTPEYFQHLDHCILELRRIGVQADLILFHPYDKWGYQSMPAEVNERYLRYVIARFSAFRNVWWSLANEFDFVRSKTNTDWDSYARILGQHDAFGHLRSIHYGNHQYEYWRGWCTHAGVQDSRMDMAAGWRNDWQKPVVFDECKYEGNIPSMWGNLSGNEMARRFWQAAAQGAYCGHGETYLNGEQVLWWSHGGTLHGTSPAKIAFLRKLLEETIAVGQGPIGFTNFRHDPAAAQRGNGSVIFYYFDLNQPAEFTFNLPEGKTYSAEYVDTQEMTRTPILGAHSGRKTLQLPGKPWGSVWFRQQT